MSKKLHLIAVIWLFLCSALETRGTAPVNDHFADRIVLTGTEIIVHASNEGATIELGEPTPFERTVWWSWTAPTNGFAQVIVGAPFDAGLLVLAGTELVQLQRVTNGISGDSGFPVAIFEVTAGTAYQIVVGGPLSTFGFGEFSLALTLTTPSSPVTLLISRPRRTH